MKQNQKLNLVLLTGILIFSSVIVMAQHNHAKGEHQDKNGYYMNDSIRFQHMLDRLSEKLNLSDDQKQKIATIQSSHLQEMKAIHELRKTDSTNAREQGKQLHAKISGEIRNVLTDEQKVKYDAMMAEKMGPDHFDMEKGYNHKGPEFGMCDSCHIQNMIDRLAEKISLTTDQKQKIIAIHNSHLQELKAIRELDKTDCTKAREQGMQLHAKISNEVRNVLTDEQKVKFDAMMAEKKGEHHEGMEKGPHHKAPGGNMCDSCHAQKMVDRLSEKINLSNDQKQKILAIHNSHLKEFKAIHELDKTDCTKAKEQGMKLHEQISVEIKQVLTDEQKVKFDAIRQKHKDRQNEMPCDR